jgi:hypothetical protein
MNKMETVCRGMIVIWRFFSFPMEVIELSILAERRDVRQMTSSTCNGIAEVENL